MLALKRLRLRIRHAERQRDLWQAEAGPHYQAAMRLLETLRGEEAALAARAEREAQEGEAADAGTASARRLKRAFTRLQCPHCQCSLKLSVQMLVGAEVWAAEGELPQLNAIELSSDSTPVSHSESTRSKPSSLV